MSSTKQPLIHRPGRRPFLFAGPCVLEGEEMALQVAGELTALAEKNGLQYVFKSSYLKANRTSRSSFTGLGFDEGLSILAKVKAEFGVPVVTDIHCRNEVPAAAEVADILQIPAFLCRQSELLSACAATGRAINIKKGQFLAPADMAHGISKIREDRPDAEIMLTERGSSFGYRDLVVDMRAITLMRAFDVPVIFDVTHSLQKPGKGGDRRFARSLARSALAAGADGFFVETHPNPDQAKCDAQTQLPLAEMAPLVAEWAKLGEVIQELEASDPPLGESDWAGLEL
jgi:2-dehydro-3-deoxyphosphooctonate aldolase (KDO 8-P synthase)